MNNEIIFATNPREEQEKFIQKVKEFVLNSSFNYIIKEEALKEEYVGVKIFDEPIFGFSDVNDSLFDTLRNKEVIGEHFKKPLEWVEKAKTVVSIFMPFTDEIVNSNAADFDYPSELWLHGRIEGQRMVSKTGEAMKIFLEEMNYQTACPTIDPRFKATIKDTENIFTSNWSERHVAFISGLGTFGLSKGIITEKGMAGRFVSVITEGDFEKTQRTYTEIYENCIKCGACIRNCPAKAISFEKGKEHIPCSKFIDEVLAKESPRYGCGKCQVKVPCTRKNPRKK